MDTLIPLGADPVTVTGSDVSLSEPPELVAVAVTVMSPSGAVATWVAPVAPLIGSPSRSH